MDEGRPEERVSSSPSSPISSSSVSSAPLPICVEEPPSYIVGVQQATRGHRHFHPYDSGQSGRCNAPVVGLLDKCCNGDLSRGLSMWDLLLPEDGSYDWRWINGQAPLEGEHLLEPNGSNTISGYLQSRPFPAFSGHLLWSPVNSHQLLETPVGVSFISLFVISWTCIM